MSYIIKHQTILFCRRILKSPGIMLRISLQPKQEFVLSLLAEYKTRSLLLPQCVIKNKVLCMKQFCYKDGERWPQQ